MQLKKTSSMNTEREQKRKEKNKNNLQQMNSSK